MKTNPLFQRLIVCLLAGLICGETFLRIDNRVFLLFIPAPVILGLSVLILVVALIAAFLNKGTRAFWIGAIRYGIAFDLAMFGFQKIFHMQFFTPLGMLDEPFSSLSKEWLTWSYFGRSYGFVVTIALSQIIGSLLLVFNRTRLLGAIFLVPVMLDIIFIDYFYELDPGVLVHASILFAGLVQLLLLDYTRLVDFFFKDEPFESFSVPIKSLIIKYAGRLSIIFGPLLLIALYISTNKDANPLRGKYIVTDLKINGKEVFEASCDSLLSVVYLDHRNECVFEFNSFKRRMYGIYDLKNESMTTKWHYPPAALKRTFSGTLKNPDDSTVQLVGLMSGDSIKVSLRKQKL